MRGVRRGGISRRFRAIAAVPRLRRPLPWRLGHWRWVRYPKDFNVRLSRDPEEYNVHWIDEDMKKETLAARKNSTAFDPQILVFEKFRSK